MFKVNNKNTSFQCFHCWLSTNKYQLRIDEDMDTETYTKYVISNTSATFEAQLSVVYKKWCVVEDQDNIEAAARISYSKQEFLKPALD